MRFSLRRARLPVLILLVTLVAGLVASAQRPGVGRPLVIIAALDDDIINPITAHFLIRAIEHAEQRQAE